MVLQYFRRSITLTTCQLAGSTMGHSLSALMDQNRTNTPISLITDIHIKLRKFFLTNSSRIETVLCLLTDGKIDPTRLPMWNKCCYIRDNLHVTFDMTFQIIGWCRFSRFCDVGLCSSDSKFQMSIAPLLFPLHKGRGTYCFWCRFCWHRR